MTYLAGQRFKAGYGVATVIPEMDFETYCEAGYVWDDAAQKWKGLDGAPKNKRGLSVVGAARYSEHPSCEVLSFKYDLKDGRGARHWRPGMPNPQELFDYMARGGLLEAWNAPFERWIWTRVCMPKYGWPAPGELRCAMAKARAFALPGTLDAAGDVMNLAQQKDKEGKRLLDKFSKPRQPTKKDPRTRVRPEDEPDDAERLYAYNEQDIVAEGEASLRVPDLDGEELEFWKCDQAINTRGVSIDLEGVNNCVHLIGLAHARYNDELTQLTGGTVTSAGQVEKLLGWLAGAHHVYASSLDEESVEELLKERDRFPPDAVRALEIRQAIGSAGVKKVFAMANRVTSAGRLCDLFNYYAARTGRATGEAVQPTNLAREGPPVYKCGACRHYHRCDTDACPWCGLPCPPAQHCPTCGGRHGAHNRTCSDRFTHLPGRVAVDWCIDAAEDALAVIATRSLEAVEYYFGEAMSALSGCLRSLFVAAQGHDLLSSDYSSIEAVVLAQIAGEQWRLDVFKTHGKIYELSVSKIAGIPFEEILAHKKTTGKHHPLRQTVGKVAELASGYQGWIGAWLAFDAGDFMSEDQIKQAILKWREASPAIVELWGGQERRRPQWRKEFYGVEGAAIQAIWNPGVEYKVTRLDGSYSGVSFIRDTTPAFGLPGTGGPLYCRLPSGRYLTYHNPRLSEGDRGLAISYEGWNTNPKNGPKGWIEMRTWGGRLVENIVQATARDILRHAIVNLERCGYPVVLHVYDEIVCEVPEGVGSLAQFEKIMATMPPWAAGWPIKADGGWRGKRYRKG
jgi:DNA polymerase